MDIWRTEVRVVVAERMAIGARMASAEIASCIIKAEIGDLAMSATRGAARNFVFGRRGLFLFWGPSHRAAVTDS